MQRQTYLTMVRDLAGQVEEVFPWDLVDEIEGGVTPLLLDIRCPHEFAAAHIAGSINVPRGVLEIAADYGYEETEPELVAARNRRVIVICRSGNRSVLAAHTLGLLGFCDVASLKTGLKGWNDFEQPLCDTDGTVLDPDRVDVLFTARVSTEQRGLSHRQRPRHRNPAAGAAASRVYAAGRAATD